MTLSFELFILIASILLFFSLMAGKTGYRFGVPTLLLFLLIGMGVGSGGPDTRISEVKPVLLPGILLAIVGVLITSFLTGN